MTVAVLTVADAALAWHDAGACVLPAAGDGSKRPAVAWADYQHTRPTRQQVATWAEHADGIGLICGAVSGHLEMLELEGPAVADGIHEQLRELLEGTGHADLWAKLITYAEYTPGGGLHWLYRVDGAPIPGNRKLARRRDQAGHLQVLIETRGEGGWTVLAPSAGTVHPTGKPWQIITGRPGEIAILTADEHATLHRAAATFDTADPIPAPFTSPDSTSSGLRAAGGTLPGDHWAETTDWADILTPAGWTHVGTRGRTRYWRRPGKNLGISATTGHGDAGDWLYVFTSSTDFEPERTYTKFGAYTVLEHGGDHQAAAAALKGAGYGRPAPEPQRPVQTAAVDGNLATVHDLKEKRSEPRLQAVDESTLERSDDGNALLLIDRFGALIRHCEDRGAWLAWDGHRWHWCDRTGGVVREYAKRVARTLPADSTAAVKHKRGSLSAGGTSAMLAQAATDSRVTVSMDELDAHPLLLNTPGGVVDLATARIAAADPAQLHTRIAAAAPDFDMPTPRWNTFLADTFAGHTDLVPFVQQLAGYSATGVVTHHVLPFLFGPGGNGKSVFLDVARALLGDYAATAPAKFLMTGQQQHETEIARLSGLRLVICSEVNQTDRFDEAKVKILTGGDALTARFMRADHFTFTPTHKLWLMGNHQPRVSGGGDSFWRRLRMIMFSNTVPPEKQVEGLADLLVGEEGPGILAWIVRGARDVLARGLGTPASVLAATGAYAREEDSLARFVADRCHIGGGIHVRVLTGDLRGAYEQWCREEGETPLNSTAFGRELRTSHGIEQTRSNGRRYYVGLTLLAPEGDDEDTPERHWSDR